MLILVCGDRNWNDAIPINNALLQYDAKVDIIIHGGARGADSIAGYVAKQLGFQVRVFPANWDLYGRAAGPIRNRQMLNEKPDLVLAFHSDIERSKGTKNMVMIARKAGVRVEVFDK